MVDKKEVQEFIPHRGDMLLVDEIREYTPTSGVGIHYVRNDEFWCAGHFPGNPIMPGVLQVEALAQTACFVALKEIVRNGGRKSIGYFTTLDKIKFFRKVLPGDVLELHVEQVARKMKLFKFRCAAMVCGETVCKAEFSAMIDS